MMTKKYFKLCHLLTAVGYIFNGSLLAAESTNINTYYDFPGVSQSDFGGVGLLQMPTARMASNGEFSANYRDNEQYRRYSVSLQILDWLETTLRYTDTRTKPYSYDYGFSGTQTHKDKGIDIKAKVLEESYYIPQIAGGFRDIAGTGLFDGEYVNANKKIGDFDFTIGIAWGYLGHSGNVDNVFCSVTDKYCHRPSSVENVGQFELGNMFKGPSSVFGGVEYQTFLKSLRLKVEYDGNDYTDEYAGNIIQDSHFNFGAVYRVAENLDTVLSYQRGNTLMWGFTLRTNLNDMKPAHINNERPAYAPQPATDNNRVNWPEVARELDEKAGYSQANIYADEEQVTVVADQSKYRNKQEADQRAATILANHLPVTTKDYVLTTQNQHLPVNTTKVDAAAFRQQQNGVALGRTEPVTQQTIPVSAPEGKVVLQRAPEELTFSAEPMLTQSIGGPESFYMYQIGAKGNADLHVTDHWLIGGSANLNIINNYDQFNYKTPPADGASLPRVRTWIREYITSSDLLLTNMQLTRMDNPAQDWYSQAYAGYLEMMYAGAGSEALYRPYGRSWAVGIDANYVKQRDWNNIMQMADYDVVTGHVTTYWQLPFINKGLAKVSVGRYLAGDTGVTLDISRQFDSGIIAGAYATKTNVSASDYGEGSFTKGFYISIPLDLMLVHPTVRTSTVSWVPLTRDGGQKLGKRFALYDLTSK